jgi:signal peptidase II
MTRNLTGLGGITALLVLIADQVMKWIVTGPLGLTQEGQEIAVLPIFTLRFVMNEGVSMGMLQAENDLMRWGLVAMTGAIAIAVAWWMTRESSRPDLFALGLVLGGAIGNIIDRIRFGYVVDYADLHFGDWSPFLVFNVADAAISIGVVILLARALLVRDKPERQGGPSDSATENVNA